jgi:4'-phosphopantetheinyl transferase
MIQWKNFSQEHFKLLPGEVHVWKAPLSQPESFLKDCTKDFSPDEQKRCERLYSDQDRNHFTAGRGMLRYILGKYLGREASQVGFSYLENGKPLLKENLPQNPLEFNLSHSNGMVLYAFTQGSPIGIDVEYLRPLENMNYLVRRILSSREYTYFLKLADSEKVKAFFRFWTCKEASFKAEGRLQSLKEIEIPFYEGNPSHISRLKEDKTRRFIEFEPAEGYCACLSTEKKMEHVSFIQIDSSAAGGD